MAKKIMKNSKVSKGDGKMSGMGKEEKRAKLTKMVAMGATGVALTAGMVAAGAVLLDNKTRQKLGESAQKAINTVKTAAQDYAQENSSYMAVAHSVGRGKKNKKQGKKARKA